MAWSIHSSLSVGVAYHLASTALARVRKLASAFGMLLMAVFLEAPPPPVAFASGEYCFFFMVVKF